MIYLKPSGLIKGLSILTPASRLVSSSLLTLDALSARNTGCRIKLNRQRISRYTDLNLGDEDLPGDLPDLGQVPGAHVELLPDAERPAHHVHHMHQTRQTLGKEGNKFKD